jgi:hypothetical protein
MRQGRTTWARIGRAQNTRYWSGIHSPWFRLGFRQIGGYLSTGADQPWSLNVIGTLARQVPADSGR